MDIELKTMDFDLYHKFKIDYTSDKKKKMDPVLDLTLKCNLPTLAIPASNNVINAEIKDIKLQNASILSAQKTYNTLIEAFVNQTKLFIETVSVSEMNIWDKINQDENFKTMILNNSILKGSGDYGQELNAVAAYSGYQGDVIQGKNNIKLPNKIPEANTESPFKVGDDNNGNVLRYFFGNDQPSAFRFIFLRLLADMPNINNNSWGGLLTITRAVFIHPMPSSGGSQKIKTLNKQIKKKKNQTEKKTKTKMKTKTEKKKNQTEKKKKQTEKKKKQTEKKKKQIKKKKNQTEKKNKK